MLGLSRRKNSRGKGREGKGAKTFINFHYPIMMLFSLMCQDKLSVKQITKKKPSFLIAALMIRASHTKQDVEKIKYKRKNWVNSSICSRNHHPPPLFHPRRKIKNQK